MPVVCDTGPLLAAAATNDRHHALCVDLLASVRDEGIVVPVTVAVEVDYLLRARVHAGAARAFLADVDGGRYILEPVGAGVFADALRLDRRHADAGLGLVDATVVATARHLRASAVLTLDHTHFRLAGPELHLLPDESGL